MKKTELIIGGINVLDKTFDFERCVLNEKNKWITKDFIAEMMKKYNINYSPSDEDMKVFKISTIHDSYLNMQREYFIDGKISKFIFHKDHKNNLSLIENKKLAIPLQSESYQRLELVGDAFIRAALSQYLFKRYPNMNPGNITSLRTKIEEGKTLTSLCKILKLNEYCIISRFMELNNNRTTNSSLLEDIFEAFIGALAMTAGADIAINFFISIVKREINIGEMIHNNSNYKDKLLKFFHEKKWKPPEYIQLSEVKTEKGNVYNYCVVKKKGKNDIGKIVAMSNGYTKKTAEQNAALKALLIYKQIREDNEDSDSEIESDVEN